MRHALLDLQISGPPPLAARLASDAGSASDTPRGPVAGAWIALAVGSMTLIVWEIVRRPGRRRVVAVSRVPVLLQTAGARTATDRRDRLPGPMVGSAAGR